MQAFSDDIAGHERHFDIVECPYVNTITVMVNSYAPTVTLELYTLQAGTAVSPCFCVCLILSVGCFPQIGKPAARGVSVLVVQLLIRKWP